MKKILEKLVEGDWNEVCNYGECTIYRKQNKRVLYEPKTDEIYMSYNYDTTSKQSASEVQDGS